MEVGDEDTHHRLIETIVRPIVEALQQYEVGLLHVPDHSHDEEDRGERKQQRQAGPLACEKAQKKQWRQGEVEVFLDAQRPCLGHDARRPGRYVVVENIEVVLPTARKEVAPRGAALDEMKRADAEACIHE